MAPSSIALALGMLATAAVSQASATADVPGTVSMKFGRMSERRNVFKRSADPHSVPVGNDLADGLYSVNVTVGSDYQPIVLQIDTGSSDVWMFGKEACDAVQCEVNGTGYYDPSNSTTYHLIDAGGFSIEYVTPGSGVVGNYFSDTFRLMGLNITNLTMAYATEASQVTTGIMGIGFADDESIVSNGSRPYPSIIDTMVNEGLIASHAYSLWLDDIDAATGTVLFGGYDTAKYTGELTVLDMQPEAGSNTVNSFNVIWSFLAVTDANSSVLINTSLFPLQAVLDSGTTLMAVPQDLFNTISDYFGVEENEELGYVVSCGIANWTGSLDFGFGNSEGPVVQVPFSELVIPIDTDFGPLQFLDGEDACTFGLEPSPDDGVWLLGDTFLRSAYVVYDLDAQQVAIAQSNWGSTSESNVRTINNGTQLNTLVATASTLASEESVAAPTASSAASTAKVAPAHSTIVFGGGESIPGLFPTESSANAGFSHVSGVTTTLSLLPVSQAVETGAAAGATTTAGSGSGASGTASAAASSATKTGAAAATLPDIRAGSSWAVYGVVSIGMAVGALGMLL